MFHVLNEKEHCVKVFHEYEYDYSFQMMNANGYEMKRECLWLLSLIYRLCLRAKGVNYYERAKSANAFIKGPEVTNNIKIY